MDNKYIVAEDKDFEIIKGRSNRLNKLDVLYYIGNNEGIEYVEIPEKILGKIISETNFMFFNRSDIKGVKINSDKILDMSNMFRRITLDYLNLSFFNTENVKSFKEMFKASDIKNLKINNLKTHNVKNFEYMFGASSIKKVDISSFYFSAYSSIEGMFYNSKIDELILPFSFPVSCKNCFSRTSIKKTYTPNETFYKMNKEWLKIKENTELILIP